MFGNVTNQNEEISISHLLEQQLRVSQDLASSDNWVDDKVDQAPTDAENRALHFVHYSIR